MISGLPIDVVPVEEETVYGVWCEACLLPSALRFPVYGVQVDDDGAHRLGRLGTITFCEQPQHEAPISVDTPGWTLRWPR